MYNAVHDLSIMKTVAIKLRKCKSYLDIQINMDGRTFN